MQGGPEIPPTPVAIPAGRAGASSRAKVPAEAARAGHRRRCARGARGARVLRDAADHRLGRRFADQPAHLHEHADAGRNGVLSDGRDHVPGRGVARLAAGSQLRAGWTGRPPGHEPERIATRARLPVGRLDADVAPRSGGRGHALAHLLRVPRLVRGHAGLRSPGTTPRQPEVPARHHVPGLLLRRRPVRTRLPGRDPVGADPPVRPAALPDPYQVEAGTPRDPPDVPRDRDHRLRGGGLPDRTTARARRPGRGLREVVLRRLGTLRRGRRSGPPARCGTRTDGPGACTWQRSSPSW